MAKPPNSPKPPKPRYTPDELADMVWSYGDNFPMRKVRGVWSYQPTKFPRRFLEKYGLTLEEYQIGVKKVFISPNYPPKKY
jgi:hypothetical protein